jgi:hypothetical protein
MLSALIALALVATPYPTNTCTSLSKTTAAGTIYMNGTTGNDLNACAVAAKPCKTLAAAFCRVPAEVNHAIVIATDGTGSVAGLSLIYHGTGSITLTGPLWSVPIPVIAPLTLTVAPVDAGVGGFSYDAGPGVGMDASADAAVPPTVSSGGGSGGTIGDGSDGGLNVTGPARISGNVTVGGALAVTGAASAASISATTMTATTFGNGSDAGLNVNGPERVTGDSYVGGSETVAGAFSAAGVTSNGFTAGASPGISKTVGGTCQPVFTAGIITNCTCTGTIDAGTNCH